MLEKGYLQGYVFTVRLTNLYLVKLNSNGKNEIWIW